VQFGLYIPPFGELADPGRLAELGARAEQAGWDGLFLWDHVLHRDVMPIADPWIALSAVACATRTLRFGPMVTPLARRRPWVVARQAATLDHLSAGRVVFGVGLGGDGWREFSGFGEPLPPRVRAERLDEALAIVVGLWKEARLDHHGVHFQISDVTVLPVPVQRPRIPIWVADIWPHPAPLRRAARYDGVFPIKPGEQFTPHEIEGLLADVARYRAEEEIPEPAHFDVVLTGTSEATWPGRVHEELDDLAGAGVTWWLESIDHRSAREAVDRTIAQGPPTRG
jgi:alkanesulfonate monooxygenase SsuD/methylene tetrahydromethanopterin reductase-like flavin-dependent oxidoreductase (luciferase family)